MKKHFMIYKLKYIIVLEINNFFKFAYIFVDFNFNIFVFKICTKN